MSSYLCRWSRFGRNKHTFQRFRMFNSTCTAANSSISTQSSKKVDTMDKHVFNLQTINQNVISMEYAVRGPLVIRAGEIERELKDGKQSADARFDEVIRANIGDCHAMGQRPITLFRQVLACVSDPSLIDSDVYPADVRRRAKMLLDGCGGKSAGSYSDSAGIECIRRLVAQFIENRDGFPSDWKNIVLSTGASDSIRSVLALANLHQCAEKNGRVGVMIPIPQYPLYTATIAEYGMHPINYYLDEQNEWSLNIDELRRAYKDASRKCKPRVLVVINPGNPTGSVLDKQNIVDIIKFARENDLMIIADEVYQQNVYAQGKQFHSFKKVIRELDIEDLELASAMSASKGYMGECGLRGGYCELVNFKPEVLAMYMKMISARLCCSVLGQMTMGTIVDEPKPSDESYELYWKERNHVLESLKERAKLAAETFNSIPGIKSNQVAGAMYAFPQIQLPEKAIQAAKEKNVQPDFFYVSQLLEQTGICVVPGSGFGQYPGTYHFRTTILPQTDALKRMLEKFTKFHLEFINKYK